MKFRFGWWNTSLSPQRGKARTKRQKSLSFDFIELILKEGIDVLCLGEVSSEDMILISRLVLPIGLSFYDLTESNGHIRFNMGIIYNPNTIEIFSHEYIINFAGGRRFRNGVFLPIQVMKELPIAMIVVHWPSKLHQKSGTTERDIFGLSLRERIAGLMEAGKSNFIVLGDFNDEPFDSPISKYLMGTRDINLALGNRQLLYNPFWKHLTDPTPFKAGGKSIISVGTQYYRGDPVERWRTFDQILVSTSLLEQDVWCLNEEATGILNPPGVGGCGRIREGADRPSAGDRGN